MRLFVRAAKPRNHHRPNQCGSHRSVHEQRLRHLQAHCLASEIRKRLDLLQRYRPLRSGYLHSQLSLHRQQTDETLRWTALSVCAIPKPGRSSRLHRSSDRNHGRRSLARPVVHGDADEHSNDAALKRPNGSCGLRCRSNAGRRAVVCDGLCILRHVCIGVAGLLSGLGHEAPRTGHVSRPDGTSAFDYADKSDIEPGRLIAHSLHRRLPLPINGFQTLDEAASCIVVNATYADGSIWKNPDVSQIEPSPPPQRLNQEFYTAAGMGKWHNAMPDGT